MIVRETIRRLLQQHGRLSADAATIGADQDLYAAGLASFTAVQVMLALEEAFGIEFPETMLNRHSFATIKAIEACIAELAPTRASA